MTGDAAIILIVEDEPPIRRLLRATLGANDYRVLEAGTGAEAVSALRHHRPDLVLLDLGLPDIDGLQLIADIRKLGPVPIVVLSSRGDEAAKVAALDAGADDIKLSPKEYDILEQLVIHAGKVLTHKHLLREVWRDESVDPQYLRVYVRQLRQKIEADPATPRHVLTEPGIGYRLV